MNYNEKLDYGREAEHYVYNHLKPHYNLVEHFCDYWEDTVHRDFQTRGVDIACNPFTNQSLYVEVKRNLKKGVFFIELQKGNGDPGWYHSSEADIMVHVDLETNSIAWYPLKWMRMHLYGTNHLQQITAKNGDILLKARVDDSFFDNYIKTEWWV